MKKIMLLVIGFLLLTPVSNWAAGLTDQELENTLQKAMLENMPNQFGQIEKQLDKIAKRLEKEVHYTVTPQQVVAWLYDNCTADFDNVAYYQFKWERSERLQELIAQGGSAEEITRLSQYVAPDDPAVKEFATQMRYVIDYSFTQVFDPIYLEGWFVFPQKPSEKLVNQAKFQKDSQLQISNLRNNLEWLTTTNGNDEDFRNFWSWLLEK